MPVLSQVEGLNQKYLQGYLAWLRNEKQYSELTAENYARDLGHLFELTADTPLAELKIYQVRRYIAQLHGKGLGGRSLARMLSAWRGFFTYLMRDHGLADNPCIGRSAGRYSGSDTRQGDVRIVLLLRPASGRTG